jgi:hypothetical protein
MTKKGRARVSGSKFSMSLGLPVGAVMNCADNTGAKNLYVISVCGWGARLNRLPSGACGDMVMATVKKGKPDLRKKGEQAGGRIGRHTHAVRALGQAPAAPTRGRGGGEGVVAGAGLPGRRPYAAACGLCIGG